MYAALCRYLAGAVQGEAVPVIKDSWSLMASIQCRDTKDQALADFAGLVSEMRPKPMATLNVS